ncbi:hypothetical protein AAFC00_002700 [Neodothiora populina]|uniref:Arginine biosynthesis bifunctional protein ArgJ, mitochondrial n=1 Tax=Neodothiora populina TaxID=2781224 RepID=A0ABR3P7Y2_9PEZI
MLSVTRGPAKRIFLSSPAQRRFYAAPTGGDPPNKIKYIPTSGTYPKGFLAGSAHAGVKASNTKFDDLALVASEKPCVAAGVFTTNVFKAAPVQVSKAILQATNGQDIQSIIVNSGCANAVTGKGGYEDAVSMARAADKQFGIVQPSGAEDSVEHLQSLVMSTGVIGQRLPITKIINKVPELHASLGNTHDHWLRTARAICTTDTFPKLVSKTFRLPSRPDVEYSIAGMTKGAGMIHPNMATLLSLITTDASIHHVALGQALITATEQSFNRISIDGDTSTNDTCAILANGAADSSDVSPVYYNKSSAAMGSKHVLQSEDYNAFVTVLTDFMVDLAKLVVRDGEGATKFVTVRVEGAKNHKTAHGIANSIVRSPLVKTALYGKDANWGRILCAIGYAAGAQKSVTPEHTSVSFIPADGSEELKLLVRGEPEQIDEVRAKAILEMEDLEILVNLCDGAVDKAIKFGQATMWTCDFSHEYVTINGDYRT